MMLIGCEETDWDIIEVKRVEIFDCGDLFEAVIISDIDELMTFNQETSTNLDLNTYNKKFFKSNALILVPFSYSSSDFTDSYETDIGIKQPLRIEGHVLIVTIDIKRKELDLYDYYPVYYAVTVSKTNIKEINEVKVIINNRGYQRP